jgi:outer membrane receptor protein involved in Fe transport
MDPHRNFIARALLACSSLGVPCVSSAADAAGGGSTVPRSSPGADTRAESIEVVGERLDKARNGLSPKTGTSQFVFDQRDIGNLPQGESTPLNQLMFQAPGVAQGDYGELHIRGEMTQPQYRINGTLIPEGISGFGQVFDLRFARRVEFVTGALPAQYNYRTNIVDIETKRSFDGGGKVTLGGGSHGTFHPAIEFSGTKDDLTYYVTGSHLKAGNGILFPTADRRALHDDTVQNKGFALVSYLPDARSRWNLMLGAAQARFQIPNVPGQTPTFPLDGVDNFPNLASADLNENQKEVNRYAVVSYEGNDGANLDYQVAYFARNSRVLFTPDPVGDLVYRGIASSVARRNHAQGLQLDASLDGSAPHTLRAGFSFSRQRTSSENNSSVFPADADGAQVPGEPFTVVDTRSVAANLYGAYVQDEWRASSRLTVNYGWRFDVLDGLTRDHQFSPRLNAVYEVGERTALHAGYARFFNPPRLELIGPDTISKFANTTNQPEIQQSSPVVPERMHYVDVGLTHKLTPALSLGLDGYAKRARDMVDFGQFGQALVYSPFNWARSRIYGIELTAQYRKDNLSAYFNAALSWARGRGISSGQYNFGQEELDYINSHWVYMDHDQRLTSSAGVAYQWSGFVLSAEAVFGSGMRNTPEGGTPNSDHLPGNSRVNVGVAREVAAPWNGKLGFRLSVINIFDRSYEIRDGTGVGVGAPQFGPRRSIYAAVTASF